MKEQLNANRFARGLRNTMHLKRTRKTRQLAPTLVNKQPQAKFKISEVFLKFSDKSMFINVFKNNT